MTGDGLRDGRRGRAGRRRPHRPPAAPHPGPRRRLLGAPRGRPRRRAAARGARRTRPPHAGGRPAPAAPRRRRPRRRAGARPLARRRAARVPPHLERRAGGGGRRRRRGRRHRRLHAPRRAGRHDVQRADDAATAALETLVQDAQSDGATVTTMSADHEDASSEAVLAWVDDLGAGDADAAWAAMGASVAGALRIAGRVRDR